MPNKNLYPRKLYKSSHARVQQTRTPLQCISAVCSRLGGFELFCCSDASRPPARVVFVTTAVAEFSAPCSFTLISSTPHHRQRVVMMKRKGGPERDADEAQEQETQQPEQESTASASTPDESVAQKSNTDESKQPVVEEKWKSKRPRGYRGRNKERVDPERAQQLALTEYFFTKGECGSHQQQDAVLLILFFGSVTWGRVVTIHLEGAGLLVAYSKCSVHSVHFIALFLLRLQYEGLPCLLRYHILRSFSFCVRTSMSFACLQFQRSMAVCVCVCGVTALFCY